MGMYRFAFAERGRLLAAALSSCGFQASSFCKCYNNNTDQSKLDTSRRCQTVASGCSKVFDAAIVGGGLVGLAVARELAVRGSSVVLLEREGALAAAAASSGNSGLGCTGYDAPVGSLERQLLRRSIRRHPSLYRSFGLSYDHVNKCGSLVVAWTEKELSQLETVLAENREAGDTSAELLNAEELRELEPTLSADALGAVFCPHEAVVEPWLVPIGYAESARLHGAELCMSTEVVGANFDREKRLWRIHALMDERDSFVQRGRSRPGELLVAPPPLAEKASSGYSHKKRDSAIEAHIVVNCAGLHGDAVEELLCQNEDAGHELQNSDGKKIGFSICPRKGQFIVFRPQETSDQLSHIIEPVATQFTKGVIAWTTVYGNVIVGPTAEPQTSCIDRSTDAATVGKLKAYGEKILPGVLKDAEVVGTYAGIRPATEHRDYQISANVAEQRVTVAGVRSTGLSAAAGIGEYVAELVEAMERRLTNGIADNSQPKHASTDMIGVTAATQRANGGQIALAGTPSAPRFNNANVPSLAELAADYQQRNNGTVEVYGRVHHVTHPISSFGMETFRTGSTL